MGQEMIRKLLIKAILVNISSDWKFSKNSRKIFNEFYSVEKPRIKIYDSWTDFEQLYKFASYKSIWLLIPACVGATYVKTLTNPEIDTWRTVIDGKFYMEWYGRHYSDKWVKQSWKGLPIVLEGKKGPIVIDGNHRLAQMIQKGRVKVMYVKGNFTWYNTFKRLLK